MTGSSQNTILLGHIWSSSLLQFDTFSPFFVEAAAQQGMH
jgi:hypothetical protein